MKTPIGLFGLSSRARFVSMRLATIFRPCDWPMTRLFRMSARVEDRLHLVLHHAADRDAGPVRDDRGDRLLVDMRVDHALVRIDGFERSDLFKKLPTSLLRIDIGAGAAAACFRLGLAAPPVSTGAGSFLPAGCSRGSDLVDDASLFAPLRLQALKLLPRARRPRRRSRRCARRRRRRDRRRRPEQPSPPHAPRWRLAYRRPSPASPTG